MAAVDESFAPVAHGELAPGNRQAFQVEHPREPEPSQRAGMKVNGRLKQPNFPQRAAAGHRIGPLVGHDPLCADFRPGPRLR